jgi:PAS domain S-box-containing protein
VITAPDSDLDNIPCGLLTFHVDGTITRLNKTMLSWLELTSEEVSTKRFGNLLSVGGNLYYQMVIVPLLSRQGFVNEINFDILVNGGVSFPCLFNAVVVKLPDQKEVVNAVIIKITDRKKHESELLKAKQLAEEETRRFETLSNVIPNIIWSAKPSGEVDFLNNRFFEEFPDVQKNFCQDQLYRLFHAVDRKKLLLYWDKNIVNGQTFDFEARIKTSNGQYTWYLICAAPYNDPNGNVKLWFGSCTNIHEHKEKQLKTVKHLNASLFEAEGVISSKDRALEKISYSQSHLVRKPLANILGLISMLAEGEVFEDHETVYTLLRRSAEELDAVVQSTIITD